MRQNCYEEELNASERLRAFILHMRGTKVTAQPAADSNGLNVSDKSERLQIDDEL